MRDFFNPSNLLTDTTDRLGVLLTLMFFAIFPLHALSAGSTNASLFMSQTTRFDTAADIEDQNHRLQAMADYAKNQLPHLIPGLPSILRDPAQWALGTLHDTENFLDLGLSDDSNEVGSFASTFLRPVADLMQPGAPDDEHSTWMSPGYHHRHGILPTHDGMMMGTHSRHDLLDHYARLDIHPYYAQNLLSSHGYWGTELVLNLASPSDTSQTTRPWGKIALGYTNGDDRMMDHGRGVDLHGELRFSDAMTLNSGLRQSDTSGASNYVLLQWKMALN